MKTGIMSEGQGSGMTRTVPACVVEGRAWQRWTAYAAVAWSLVYAALGLYWAVSGRGFPYAAELVSGPLAPVAGLFGPGVSWTIVIIAGIPAAVMGVAMLLGYYFRQRGRAVYGGRGAPDEMSEPSASIARHDGHLPAPQ